MGRFQSYLIILKLFTKNLTVKFKQNSTQNINQFSLRYIYFISLLKEESKNIINLQKKIYIS